MIKGIETGQRPNEDLRLPRGERRQLLLDNLALPNPDDPQNPYGYRFGTVNDDEFLMLSFPDKVANGTYNRNNCATSVRSGLNDFFSMLEYPQGVSFHVIEKARASWQLMLGKNPRLAGRSQSELIAEFRRILSGERAKDLTKMRASTPQPIEILPEIEIDPAQTQTIPDTAVENPLSLKPLTQNEARRRGGNSLKKRSRTGPGAEKLKRLRNSMAQKEAQRRAATSIQTYYTTERFKPDPKPKQEAISTPPQVITRPEPESDIGFLENILRPGEWTDLPFGFNRNWRSVQPVQEEVLED